MSDVKKWDDINGAAPEPEKDEYVFEVDGEETAG